jgi:hypothetical protein
VSEALDLTPYLVSNDWAQQAVNDMVEARAQLQQAHEALQEHPADPRLAEAVMEKAGLVLVSTSIVGRNQDAVQVAQARGIDVAKVEMLAIVDLEKAENVLDDVKVTTVSVSEWHTPEPGWEYRRHLGHSELGWHTCLEISQGGGDGGFAWGEAYQTREEAEAALKASINQHFYPERERSQELDLSR